MRCAIKYAVGSVKAVLPKLDIICCCHIQEYYSVAMQHL